MCFLNTKSNSLAKPTPITGWASMKPSINITRDYFGVMKQATIKFGLPPNNDVDIGRVESLKDLLKVITGPPKQGYQCNNPKELPNLLPERKSVFLHTGSKISERFFFAAHIPPF
jgi:hypothetical protein